MRGRFLKMESTKNENVVLQQDQINEEEKVKVDVVEVGQPDESLLWERKFRKQGKSI